MMKSSKSSSDYFISLGFPEKPKKDDFDFENFPSKLGGIPVWLLPPDIDLKCLSCSNFMTFLIQIYCPLENMKHCFHRSLYIFFCKNCWRNNNTIKVFRTQASSSSYFYKEDQLLFRDELKSKADAGNINLNHILTPEFIIDSCQEHDEATRIYIKFYDKLDEKSQTQSIESDDEIEEDDLIVENPDISDEKVDKLIKNYYKENEEYYNNGNKDIKDLEQECESDMVNKLQENVFKNLKDIFYDVFSKVVSFDPQQVLRYCRDDVIPLWFTNQGMLTIKNTKCKNCGGEMIFECQIMPNIFNIYKEIFDLNIGTIVIYTCKSSCNSKKGNFLEEYAYIQRTGEKILDLSKGISGKANSYNSNINVSNTLSEEDKEFLAKMNKLTVKGNTNNEPDEDGWVEVKKKKKKDP
jgi:pre-rRNA-processing protein TSR4